MTAPKILIVEDDAELGRLLAAELRNLGYEVVSAEDGAMAIMLAQRHRPQTILLDIGLPGADGMVVMRRLKTLTPLAGIPVIVLTGKTLSPEQERDLGAQAHALLRKPVNFQELLATIQAAGPAPGANPETEDRRGV